MSNLIKFRGVRGSFPGGFATKELRQRMTSSLISLRDAGFDLQHATDEQVADAINKLPEELSILHGSNTTCVEMRFGEALAINDMGMGARELGDDLLGEAFSRLTKTNREGIYGTIYQSHVHWDHIQGLPAFAPIYVSRKVMRNHLRFIGGMSWKMDLETVLRGQMHDPYFPVEMKRLKERTLDMDFSYEIDDEWESDITDRGSTYHVKARTLNHPQETFGYRFEHQGFVVAFTTDHEPYATPDPRLIELAQGADVWITDCQYTRDVYDGKKNFKGKPGGVSRHSWGHSFPEYIAEVAKIARPGMIVTTHHDPAASTPFILDIAKHVEHLCGIKTVAAYEGMTIEDGAVQQLLAA